MRDRAPTLPTTKFDDPQLSAAMRSIDAFMRSSLQWRGVQTFDSLYTEPLRIAMAQQPVGILCVRVRSYPNLAAPLVAGGVCPFEWDGQKLNAVIGKVPGLTVGTGTKYRFDFVTVG